MKSQATSSKHEEFSLPNLILTVGATLAALALLLRFFFPTIWSAQLNSSLGKGAAVFAAVSLLNCFIEYFFHRYVLHTPALPWLKRFYRLHTLHHGLTHVVRKTVGKNSILYIENKFPIIEPEQHEASFFPWYTLTVFSLLLSPLFALLQFLTPSFPWFLSGYLALASSLILYEVLHAVNHWSLDRWAPLLTHPQWKKIWVPVYGFHLRHHAVTDCNESISGFFGLPVADWVFRTCIIPKTVYSQGEAWSPEKFESPRPRALIRWLDQIAVRNVRKQRLARVRSADLAREATHADLSLSNPRRYTRGEEIANWLTHGIGLVISCVGLTLLIVYSSLRGDAWHVVSFTVFGITLLILYTVSTIAQSRKNDRIRLFFLKFDRAAAFLVIAGTYTPFMLVGLRGPWGWSLFGVIWGLCGAGAVFQLLFGRRFRSVSTLAYLFVGWLFVVALRPMIEALPAGALWLLVAGALCYSVGMVFYRWHRLKYHHAFWRGLLVAGSTCHYLAVLLFLLPKA